MAFRCVFLLCLISVTVSGAFDPCTDHYYLYDSGDRSPSCTSVNNESDDNITEHWYRVINQTSSLNLTSRYVPANGCGTVYPIWLNGDHPSVSDGVVNRTVCVTSSSYRSNCSCNDTIQIRNCTTFYVYNLTKTRQGQRYCFDSKSGCPSGESTTTSSTTRTTWFPTTSNETIDIGYPSVWYPKSYSTYSKFACIMFIGGFLIGVLTVSIIMMIRKRRAIISRHRSTQPAPRREPAQFTLPPSYSEVVGGTTAVSMNNSTLKPRDQ